MPHFIECQFLSDIGPDYEHYSMILLYFFKRRTRNLNFKGFIRKKNFVFFIVIFLEINYFDLIINGYYYYYYEARNYGEFQNTRKSMNEIIIRIFII